MPTDVSVLVTYAYGYGGPFERDYPADTPIATARDAAIKHFRLEHEPTTAYHLSHLIELTELGLRHRL